MTPAPLHAVPGRRGPASGPTPGQRHHILSVLVENKAGVLARVAGLFSRRGFNIYSLAVAPTDEDEHFSRITIVVDVESAPLEQVIMQLDKLVNVVSIDELSPAEAVERELVLVTVAVGPDRALAGHTAGRRLRRRGGQRGRRPHHRHAGRPPREDRRLRGPARALHRRGAPTDGPRRPA